MTKLMTVCGIVLAAIGAAFILIDLFEPGRLDAMMIPMDAATTLLVGGLLCIGIGGINNQLEMRRRYDQPVYPEGTQFAEVVNKGDGKTEAPVAAKPAFVPPSIPGFRRKLAEDALPAVAAVTAAGATLAANANKEEAAIKAAESLPSMSAAETIEALDKAKADVRAALGGLGSDEQHAESLTPPPEVKRPAFNIAPVPPVVSEPEPEPEIVAEETGELYVVEEKIVRNRPARILSDGTVEAETDEGWMRFENLEHLNEYLDG